MMQRHPMRVFFIELLHLSSESPKGVNRYRGRADNRSSHVRGAPKAEVSRALRLLEALDAQQNFEPFRLTEECD